jgi:hypothetical protein
MKIDWSKINDNTVVNCKTKEESITLLKEFEKHGGEMCDGETMFEHYLEDTCYEFEKDGGWSYCDKDFYIKHNYNIIEFSDLVVNKKSKVSELLNLENGQVYNILNYGSNPCEVDENYSLINSEGFNVSGKWLIKIIEDNSLLIPVERKQMTLREIEEELGYYIEIIK